MPVVNPARTGSLPDSGRIPTQPTSAQVSAVDHAGNGTAVRHTGCRETCAFDEAAQWHHDRLITIENDQEVLLELIEVAVTWAELEYAETAIVPPDGWMTFVESHRWAHPERVARIFGLAIDIVMAARRPSRHRPEVSDPPVDDAAPATVSDISAAQRTEVLSICQPV